MCHPAALIESMPLSRSVADTTCIMRILASGNLHYLYMAMLVKFALSATVNKTSIRPMKNNVKIMDPQAWHFFFKSQNMISMDSACKSMENGMQADSVSRASIGDYQDN